MAYLAGSLRSAGVAVTCIDGAGEALDQFRKCPLDSSLIENGLTIDEIVARIPPTTDVIGVSLMFSFEWFYSIELIRAIRLKFPRQFLVLGGEHATAEYDYVLRTMPEIDACVVGEGENKLLGLIQALTDGVSKLEIPGIAVLDGKTGIVKKNEEKDGQYRILDVNSIPRPAWDLFPIENYLSTCGYQSIGFRAMPMLASRGCPHKCTFCSSPQMWTTRWKARDIDDVISEIKFYIEKYQINRVEFWDLTAIIDKRWIVAFCQRLLDENLGITWAMPSGTRTEALTPEVLELIKKSGCNKLTYPLESGSALVNKLVNKKVNLDRSLSSMRVAVKAGIIVKSHIIIGFPWQTYRDVFREYFFGLRLAWIGSHETMFYNFHPYPGSELHAQLVREGKIVRDENYPLKLRQATKANLKNCQSWAPAIPGPHLWLLCIFGYFMSYSLQFVFHPRRIIAVVKRFLAGKPITGPELILSSLPSRALKWIRSRRQFDLNSSGT
jgi:anaerobic magnesium-protoporphyrin IX monomethyl ester cyclase